MEPKRKINIEVEIEKDERKNRLCTILILIRRNSVYVNGWFLANQLSRLKEPSI